MSRFKLRDTTKLSAVVGSQLPEDGEVTVLIPGCGHPFRIKLEFPAALGDTVEIDAEIVGVSDRTVALRYQGRILTLDVDYLRTATGNA